MLYALHVDTYIDSRSQTRSVLFPVLFCVYIDDVIRRLESSRLGCWVSDCYIGCIVYAADLSASVCDLQKMIDLCAYELCNTDIILNASKCAILRFGPRYSKPFAQMCIQGSPVRCHDKTKYLGVMLHSTVKFSIDLSYMKSKFYRAFNSLFHKTGRFQDEVVTHQLVSAYCKPYLIYATECLGLSVTQVRSLRNTWLCAVSHIFHVSGVGVQFIRSVTDKSSLDMIITGKRIRFLANLLRHHSENDILYNLYMCAGGHELSGLVGS